MRVLVAEDDPGLRDVIVLGLLESGYQVDAVDRGDDAIDQLTWYDYDVAIIDWRMPGAEGIDVVAWARRPRATNSAPHAHSPRRPRRPHPRPGHGGRRLSRQAVRLRRAAGTRPRAPAASARCRRAGVGAGTAGPRPGDASRHGRRRTGGPDPDRI